MTPDGLTITTSERAQAIPWRRIVAAWDAGQSLLLILGPHASLALPKASMPEGAADFIQESIGSAWQGSGGDSKDESSRNGRFFAWLSQERNFLIAGSYREIVNRHGIRQSMSRKGDCWDNAPMESFFHTLKRRDLLAQLEDVLLPVALRVEPGESGGEPY